MQRNELYIGGEWVKSDSSQLIDVFNPSTEQVCGHVPQGTAKDVARAAACARGSFDSWSQTPVNDRVAILGRSAELLSARMMEIGSLIATEVGMPLPLSLMIQTGLPISVMASYVDIAKSFEWETQVGNSLVVREAAGVVGCITPWNYPLHQLVAKVAAALAAGCTVVAKPSELAPLNAFILAEVFHGAGLPAGVFNLVTGYGPEVGEALAIADIDVLSFTGSVRTAQRLSELVAPRVLRTSMELGGKSASILFEDVNFGDAVNSAVTKAMLNSGQTCMALTRLLVPRKSLSEVEEAARAAVELFPLGDPFADATRLGPVISAEQRTRVRSFIDGGVAGGAKLLCGGSSKPEGLDVGYFVRPTVFTNVENDMTISQEEIFGPVLSIITFNDEDDAVRIANDSPYGLSGAVSSGDLDRANRVARRMRTGQVSVNDGPFNPLAPFGGYKMSGHGRELGVQGLEEFLVTKAISS